MSQILSDQEWQISVATLKHQNNAKSQGLTELLITFYHNLGLESEIVTQLNVCLYV